MWLGFGQFERFVVNQHPALTSLHYIFHFYRFFQFVVGCHGFSLLPCHSVSISAGKFEEAYNGYTAALHWLAPDDSQKSHILVALASLQYKFQKSEEAKELLFQG